MNLDLRNALAEKLLAMADDEMILGHRNSDRSGHAPILEEDIAFANIALDEIGHAIIWYSLLSDLLSQNRETYPNKLVYHRAVHDFRCAPFVELPRGDWAFSILRQYLFDAAEKVYLDGLRSSRYKPLVEAATTIRLEEAYHLRHTSACVRRLGLDTEASNQRMQQALDELWPYALALFDPLPNDHVPSENGYLPEMKLMRSAWSEQVIPFLEAAGLKTANGTALLPSNRIQHSEYLEPLIHELQQVARRHPGAGW